jgi:hypothetical protein
MKLSWSLQSIRAPGQSNNHKYVTIHEERYKREATPSLRRLFKEVALQLRCEGRDTVQPEKRHKEHVRQRDGNWCAVDQKQGVSKEWVSAGIERGSGRESLSLGGGL